MTENHNLEKSYGQDPEIAAAEQAMDDAGADQVPTGTGEDQQPEDAVVHQATADHPPPKPCTDLGNAERLVEKFGNDFRFCPETKRWYVYRQGRWITDPGGRMNRMAYKVARSIYDEAKDEKFTSNEITELKKHAKKSSSKGRIRAMIDLARWFAGISVRVALLDRDPWLLNCQNGTLDLRTGELRPHDPMDLITKMLPVDYKPDATCPLWEAAIDKILGGNAEKIGFLKRVLGYGMTGLNIEQCMFVLYGSGANGKSTILEIYRELLSGYGMHTTTSSLLGSQGHLLEMIWPG